MNENVIGLSQRYVSALQRCLKSGSRKDSLPALKLGRQAVGLGLETLEMARVHEQAVSSLNMSTSRIGLVRRAEWFFAEVITPILETHRAARQNSKDLKKTNELMARRTLQLTKTTQRLQQCIVRRKRLEAALKKCGVENTKLLKDSFQLHQKLRRLIHKLLVTQEDERGTLSRELQDEVAQSLLGINVRLITLKQQARTNAQRLKSGIVSAEQSVLQSAGSLGRVSRSLSNV